MRTQENHILVADDNRQLADLYAAWLSPTYPVTTAYSGRDAVASLDETVDIVLLDRRMPGMPGREVLEEIRDRDLDSQVALITSLQPDFDILDHGFDAYLEKVEAGGNSGAQGPRRTGVTQFTRLTGRIAELEDELEQLQDGFTDADFRSLFHQFS